MDLALHALEVVALGILSVVVRIASHVIRDALHHASDKLLDKSPELDLEAFLQRFVELEGRVELLPSIWEETYAKVRRAEERIRKSRERANAKSEDGGGEEEEGIQGVLPMHGGGASEGPVPPEDEPPAGDPDDELRMTVFARRFGA